MTVLKIKPDEFEDKDVLWKKCVAEGRLLLMSRQDTKKRICDIAMEACQIIHGGGGHWSNFQNQTHLRRFATEIGMNPKTLGNWMVIRRHVYNHLPEKYQGDNFSWSVGEKCRNKASNSGVIRMTKQAVVTAYENLLNQTPEQRVEDKIIRYVGHIRSNLKTMTRLEMANTRHVLNVLVKDIEKKIKGNK